MGYFTDGDAWRDEDTATLLSLTTENDGTTNGTAYELDGSERVASVALNVSAATAGTLDVKVQGRNAAGSWFDIQAFTQVTDGTGSPVETFAIPLGARAIRGVAVIAATGTYSCTLVATTY